MADYLRELESRTNVKHNFSGYGDKNTYDVIFRDNIRLWNKKIKVIKGGLLFEPAIQLDLQFPLHFQYAEGTNLIIPYDLFLEPYYELSDVDLDNTTAEYDNDLHKFKFKTDVLSNNRVLQSNTISLQHNRKVRSIHAHITAHYEGTDEDASYNFLVEVYDGNTWLPVNQNGDLVLGLYEGADLDAELNADLYQNTNNYDYDTATFSYQNAIKYRLTCLDTTRTIILDRFTLKINWEF